MKKFVRVNRTAIVILLSCSIVACSSTVKDIIPDSLIPDSKEDGGKGIGALTGGLLANYLCADKYKTLCVAGGAILGAIIGGEIGKHLDEQDKKKMEQATKDAIRSGESYSWTSDEKGTSGSAAVLNTSSNDQELKFKVLKKRIKKVPPIDIIGDSYKAKGNPNLRGGPGTDYEVVGSLQPNQVVTVVGKVKGKDWYLISQDGIASGFIWSQLLEYAPDATEDRTTEFANAEVAETNVTTSQTCREIEQSIKLADGDEYSEKIEACREIDGWKIKA